MILDVSSLPITGDSKYLYHNTTDGYFYYWNDVQSKFIKLENLNVITTVQPTPTTTGNTTNLNSTFKDANGDTWVVDSNGDAIKAGAAPTADVAYSKMLFVDPVNGNDLTGTGSDNKMYRTIAKALTVANGSGYRIVLGAGTYTENPTISLANLDIVTVAGSDRGNTSIQGTVTFTHTSSSSGIQGISMSNLVHSGAGALYVTDCQINTLLNKTSAAYIEINNSTIQTTSTSTLSAGSGLIMDSLISNLTISGASSAYTLKSNIIDATGSVNFTGGSFYNIQDNSGNINVTAGTNLETALIAQGLSSTLAKQYVTDFSTKLGMLNPDTQNSPSTIVSFNNTTKRLELSPLSSVAGDKYKTTSTTCNDIVSTGNLTFTVETGLAYTPLQDIIIYADAANHMHGEVVSYNSVTGVLVMNVHQKTGSGNFCNWTVNLDAIKLAEVSVYFNLADPITAGQTGIEGDLFYKTSTGDKTGTILETWVYDGTTWVKVDFQIQDYATVVYVNAATPATATIFDLENPPVTNDDSLKNLDTAIYIGTDGSTWNSNGTTYSTYTPPANTEWYLANTTTDAGGNKTGAIYRTGNTGININNPLNKFVVKGNNAAATANGTAQSNATFRVDGDSNHTLDMGTLAVTPFGSYVQSYNKASIATLPLVLNPTGGNIGINVVNPVSSLANTANSIQGTNTVGAISGGLNWSVNGTGFAAAFYSQPTTGNGLLVKVNGATSANNLFEVSTGTQSSVPAAPVIKALGDGNVGINNTNPTVPIDVINRGTGQYLPVARFLGPSNTISGNNTQMVFGTAQGAGNCADWRFFYAGNSSNNNRIDFGMSGRVTPMISYLYSGFTGINNTTPLSFLDVGGSFGALERGSSVSTTTSGDHTVWMAVAGTTCTLEAPTVVRRRIMFIKNTSSGIVTVAGHIDGTASTTRTLLPKESIIIQSDSSTWQIIAKYDSPTPLAVSTQLNQVTIPTSTNTLLTTYTNVSDTSNGAWNAATGVFTCNKAGLYRFQFRAMFSINTWNQGNEVNAQFLKNGVNVNNASWFAASTYNQYAFSGDNVLTLNLVVGDTIQVRMWHNGPAGRQTYLPAYQIYTINEIR